MNDCLVTRLKGVVDNDSLLMMGEMAISVPAGNYQTLRVNYFDNTVAKKIRIVSGTGTITNEDTQETGTQINTSIGKSTPFGVVATTNLVLGIPDKYGIITFDIHGCTAKASDIDFFKQNTDGQYQTFRCSVEGSLDIATLNPNWNAFPIGIEEPSIKGEGLFGNDTGSYQNADLTVLYGAEVRERYRNNNMFVDFSLVPVNCYQIDVYGNTTVFPWKGTRSTDAIILAFPYAPINLGNDLDKMLIDQANCETDVTGGTRNNDPNNFIIKAKGTRTSSSDSAVSTLKTKGFTIIVNGQTL